MYSEIIGKVNCKENAAAVENLIYSCCKLVFKTAKNEFSKQLRKEEISIEVEIENVKAAIRKANEILDTSLDEENYAEISIGMVTEIFENRN